MNDTYNTTNTKSRRKNDCVIIALSNVTGMTYEEVEKILREVGAIKSKNGGVYSHTKDGNVYEKYFGLVKFDKYSAGNCCDYSRYATAVELLKTGKYLCIVPHHAFSVVDGVSSDVNVKPKQHVQTIYMKA